MHREYEASLKCLAFFISWICHILLLILLFFWVAHQLQQLPFSQADQRQETEQAYIPLVHYNTQPPMPTVPSPHQEEYQPPAAPTETKETQSSPAEVERPRTVTTASALTAPPKQRRGKSAWTAHKKVEPSSASPHETSTTNALNGHTLQQAFGNFMNAQREATQKKMNNDETRHAFEFAFEAYTRKMVRVMKETAAFYRRTVHIPQQILTKVLVTFELLSNGTMTNLTILEPTGNRDIDQAIEEFFRLLKFPPLPKAITEVRSSLIINNQVQIRQIPGVRDLQFTVDSFW